MDRSAAFQTWEFHSVLPLPYGDVKLRIMRYKQLKGPKLVLVHDMKILLGLTKEAIRDHCNCSKVNMYTEDDKSVQKRLAELGAIKPNKKAFMYVKLSGIIKVVHAVGAWEVLYPMLVAASQSEPPTSANERGSQKLQRATDPWQPLPLTPAMEIADLEMEELGDQQADEQDDAQEEEEEEEEQGGYAQQRNDRGPAFVSARIGR